MEINYDLNSKDIEEAQLTVRFVCDRQERPSYFLPKGHESGRPSGTYVESYVGPFRRRDMFWVEIRLDGVNLGSVSIEPDLKTPTKFTIRENWCKVHRGYEALCKRIEKFFRNSPEYQRQIEWTTKLAKYIQQDLESNFQTTLVSKRWGWKPEDGVEV